MGDPHIGLVLEDRYRIQERLAAGGTGVVYQGVQLGLARQVAIKFLHQSSAGSQISRGRFRREAEAMSRLTHPNLAAIIDFGAYEGTLYLVMELYEGLSLRQVLDAGALEPARAVNITRQILAGLASAHDAGVVHRDLKPGNVLLAVSLGDDHVKILDFGVAKLIGGPVSTEGLSVVGGKPIGTPQYMSPEQARGQAADARTDLYAVGILLYEMTTGVRPFDGSGAGFAILRQQVEDSPKPPREHCPQMSESLEAAILKAMAKDPEDRFHSAEDMAAALALVPELEPPRSEPDARRPRRIAAAALALLLVVAGGAAGVWLAAERGLIEMPAWAPWQPRQTAIAGEVSPPVLDAAVPDAPPPPPPWSPPDAEVELAAAPPSPPVDNRRLVGALGADRFRPEFARVAIRRDRAVVSFAATAPDDPCGEIAPLAIAISLPASSLIEGERIADVEGASVTASGRADPDAPIEPRWWLRLDRLDAGAGVAAGRVRLRAKRLRMRGRFEAVYCPDPREYATAPPRVNGTTWNPDRAPRPEALPASAVAGALGARELHPAHANLVAAGDPERWVLSFFESEPVDPCAELGAGERGVAVVLAPGVIDESYAISAVLDPGDRPGDRIETPWVGIQTELNTLVEADILALQIDAISHVDVRGRLYIAAADRRRSLVTGAFRAIDCR